MQEHKVPLKMTEQQFNQTKWKPFEIVSVYVKEYNRDCSFVLIGIDFVERKMTCKIADPDIWEDGIFEFDIKLITRGVPKRKLKIVK
jgi:hypothetical protein